MRDGPHRGWTGWRPSISLTHIMVKMAQSTPPGSPVFRSVCCGSRLGYSKDHELVSRRTPHLSHASSCSQCAK